MVVYNQKNTLRLYAKIIPGIKWILFRTTQPRYIQNEDGIFQTQ